MLLQTRSPLQYLPADPPTENSVDFLTEQGQNSSFARADIAKLAKRLAAGEPTPVADPDDSAALKVEKNALAILYIPALFALAEEILAAHPRMVFCADAGGLQAIDGQAARSALDPRLTQGGLCQLLYRSMSNLFHHVARHHLATLRRKAIEGSDSARMTEALLVRYETALSNYQRHTPSASLDFTPTIHLMAGIHTALFFILRALSAITVLGARRLDRAITREELSAAVTASAPLLLAIARGHLEQLLALEELLGKSGDLFMTALDGPAYESAIAAMFTLAPGEALQLELSEAVRAALPRQLTSAKPRTSCPALFAVTRGTENAIHSLIRQVESAFAGMMFPGPGMPAGAAG